MSLTKATLLSKVCVAKPELLGEFYGLELYVKSVTELQRSRRMSQLFDAKKEQMRPDALQRARCLTLVDHLCDEDGEPLFKESDVNDIMKSDAQKMDVLCKAIEEWSSKREGKPRGK